MRVVQGEYENGVVKLLEEIPETASKKVLITFFDEDETEDAFLRQASLRQPKQFLQEYLSDEREDLYQEYLSKNNDNR